MKEACVCEQDVLGSKRKSQMSDDVLEETDKLSILQPFRT